MKKFFISIAVPKNFSEIVYEETDCVLAVRKNAVLQGMMMRSRFSTMFERASNETFLSDSKINVQH